MGHPVHGRSSMEDDVLGMHGGPQGRASFWALGGKGPGRQQGSVDPLAFETHRSINLCSHPREGWSLGNLADVPV